MPKSKQKSSMGVFKDRCAYCNKLEELRPYGRDGALICFDCAMKPENKQIAEDEFNKRLEIAAVGGNGVIIIGGTDGPVAATTTKVKN